MFGITPADARRRELPIGTFDPDSDFGIPRPMRSFYLTVTVDEDALPQDPVERHNAIIDAAFAWMLEYKGSTGRNPGTEYIR